MRLCPECRSVSHSLVREPRRWTAGVGAQVGSSRWHELQDGGAALALASLACRSARRDEALITTLASGFVSTLRSTGRLPLGYVVPPGFQVRFLRDFFPAQWTYPDSPYGSPLSRFPRCLMRSVEHGVKLQGPRQLEHRGPCQLERLVIRPFIHELGRSLPQFLLPSATTLLPTGR